MLPRSAASHGAAGRTPERRRARPKPELRRPPWTRRLHRLRRPARGRRTARRARAAAPEAERARRERALRSAPVPRSPRPARSRCPSLRRSRERASCGAACATCAGCAELLLRDLGGFVFDAAPLPAPARGDRDGQDAAPGRGRRRAAHARAGARRPGGPVHELREPGIGGICDRCGAFFSSRAKFCSDCGAPAYARAPLTDGPEERRRSRPPSRRRRAPTRSGRLLPEPAAGGPLGRGRVRAAEHAAVAGPARAAGGRAPRRRRRQPTPRPPAAAAATTRAAPSLPPRPTARGGRARSAAARRGSSAPTTTPRPRRSPRATRSSNGDRTDSRRSRAPDASRRRGAHAALPAVWSGARSQARTGASTAVAPPPPRVVRPRHWRVPLLLVSLLAALAGVGVAVLFVALSGDDENIVTTGELTRTITVTTQSPTATVTHSPPRRDRADRAHEPRRDHEHRPPPSPPRPGRHDADAAAKAPRLAAEPPPAAAAAPSRAAPATSTSSRGGRAAARAAATGRRLRSSASAASGWTPSETAGRAPSPPRAPPCVAATRARQRAELVAALEHDARLGTPSCVRDAAQRARHRRGSPRR